MAYLRYRVHDFFACFEQRSRCLELLVYPFIPSSLPFNQWLRLHQMLLRFHQKVVHFRIYQRIQVSPDVLHLRKWHVTCLFLVRLELLKHDGIVEFEEILENLIPFDLGNLGEFVEEHFQNHQPLVKMFVIVPSVLAFFGYRGNGEPGMAILESGFEPEKIVVPSFDSFPEAGRLDDVGNVGLLEDAPFLFLEFENFYLHIFIQQLVGWYFLTVDDLREVFLLRMVVELQVLSAFLHYILAHFLHRDGGRLPELRIFFIAVGALEVVPFG